MEKKRSRIIFYFIAALFLIAFTMQQAFAQSGDTLKAKLKAGQYITKVDNFLVLFDNSHSMSEPYQGTEKLELAINFVSRMNQTLPDLKINSALRKFGFVGFFSGADTVVVSGPGPYAKKPYEDAIRSITRAGGISPMAAGIKGASDDLKTARGNIAVIIISDWDELGTSPIVAVEDMKKQYGERICIYPVMVSKEQEGIKLMEKIAAAGQCGFTTFAEKVATERDMEQFIEKVFLTKAIDSDNDGVLDNFDKCPDTPAGVKIDKDGCPLDSDNDGVPDYLDKCPGTRARLKVDKVGCPLDSDNDGVPDYLDKCPDTPTGVKVDKDGCTLDSDNDGVLDSLDKCPDTPTSVKVDKDGCPLDSDNDDVPDYLDLCPDTPAGVSVDKDGCPFDSDNDGVYDYIDKCPNTPAGVKVNKDGCPPDSDKDGVPDYLDKCPETPTGAKVDKDGCPLDSDKDGVPDYLDKCPDTPVDVKVDGKGCPLDADKDGVSDYLDKCPDTPADMKVDNEGCPVEVSITLNIEFATGKSRATEKHHEEIKLVADFMKKFPQTNAVIEGHTDNVGREKSNIALSQARANSVKKYLIKNFGIEEDRLQAVGHGPKKPIASNDTTEGKQKNRRVRAVINAVINAVIDNK